MIGTISVITSRDSKVGEHMWIQQYWREVNGKQTTQLSGLENRGVWSQDEIHGVTILTDVALNSQGGDN